jgi:hypothetical protein
MAMSRRKSRTRRKRPREPVILLLGEPPMADQRSGWWGLVKAVLLCGVAGGLAGAAVDAALRTGGYALPAALIGGIPAGVIGACALGWYGWLFGAMNRLRHGVLIGAALGLLGAGTLGMIAGLSVWALPWSLPGAILGAVLQTSLTRPERRSFGRFPGVVLGALTGILMQAVRAGPADVMTDASDGAIVGAVLGVLLIPALLAWLTELPELIRRRRRRR